MGFLGTIKLTDNLTFYVNTYTYATGAAVDADAVPGYRVYENETTAPLLTGSMALLDDVDTVGFYSETIAVTTANGFEVGKCYAVRITCVVAGATLVELQTFQVGVVLEATQPAITWGQQKIVANVDSEGALDIINAHATGIGTRTAGGSGGPGQLNLGGSYGTWNWGTNGSGILNLGPAGQINNGLVSSGCYNTGITHGEQNFGSGAGALGQLNTGPTAGQFNAGTDGSASGQVNIGGTYGVRMEGTALYGLEMQGGIRPVNPDLAVDGDTMGLEDDAITSAKFDEGTAFPNGSPDVEAMVLP